MNKLCNTLVMTSAIQPSRDMSYLTLSDPDARLFETYCSLISWIRKTEIKNIILCDNTSVEHDFSGLQEFAIKYKKNLEILIFSANQEEIAKKGKGYGEGVIMKYAIMNSILLRNSSSFYKITGRLFIENFNDLNSKHYQSNCHFILVMKRWKKYALSTMLNTPFLSSIIEKNIEFSRHPTCYIPTVFYMCNKQYYMDHLIDCHNSVDDKSGHCLEDAFFIPLIKNKFSPFSVRPTIVGRSGSQGRLYENIDYDKDIKDSAKRLLENASNKYF